MMQGARQNPVGLRISLFLSAGIALGWLVLVSFYVRGRLVLGHWPRISADDPQELGLPLYYAATGYALKGLLLCMFAAVVVCVVLLVRARERARISVTILAVAVGTSVAIGVFSPLVSWYLD